MPVYEYEHADGPCALGEHRFAVVQPHVEPAYVTCPWCGDAVRRVVSAFSFKTRGRFDAGKAAKKGLTTWKRAAKGEWEKVDGPGVDAIVASPEDRADFIDGD